MSSVSLSNNSNLILTFNDCGLPSVDDAGAYLMTIYMLINFVVGLPANLWVLWLIGRGTKDLLSTEFFPLSLAFCEILFCVVSPLHIYCVYTFDDVSVAFESLLRECWCFILMSRPLFQCCICLERYLAVIHPLIFIRFKPPRYRVTCCGLAWCVLFVLFGIVCLWSPYHKIKLLSWFATTVCLMLYCCLSVLWSLKRPGPGKREREGGDTIKIKAFNIILVHLAYFVVSYLPVVFILSMGGGMRVPGILTSMVAGVLVLSGQVQPIIYLHRAGKITCTRKH